MGSEVPFWAQEAHCIFMIMHLFDLCLKNWQHAAIKVFLQNTENEHRDKETCD